VIALALAAWAQVVTVTGTLQYEDRDYNNSGFTGTTTPRPIRSADLEILRASDGTVLGTGLTDPATGMFSVGGITMGEIVQARVYARHSGNRMNAVVRNNATANAVYTGLTPPLDTSATASFGVVLFTIAGGAAPAFNIFDCAVKSFRYQASVDVDLPALPALLLIYWEAGSTNGSYYSSLQNAVFLLGSSADPDEYDDDIILHEIGHWVAHNFSKDDTLGGPHTIVDQLDPRTSWSEGWAHYWSATVRRFFPGEYPSPQTQVDNFGTGFSVFGIDPPSFPSQTVMATNEVAVATVLWDITDTQGGTFDLGPGHEQAVWQAVSDRIPLMTAITLEKFHDGLLLETSAAFMATVTGSETVQAVMNWRQIRYYPDSSEPNNTAAASTPLAPGPTGLSHRTFFPAGDEDWYAVALVTGTLVAETLSLGDGADTNLELYAPDGTTLLASNNDRSPTDKSSLLQFWIVNGGTYFLRVTNASPILEYGYYDVRAQIILDAPPVVTAVSASTTLGYAPLRVTLSGAAGDLENAYLEYQWDFEGSGLFEWASLQGPRVTTTYAKPGLYNATFRVVDGAGLTATGSVSITVLPSAAPTIVLTQSSAGGAAPVPATFGVSVQGVIPVSYSWDFAGTGLIDQVSVTPVPVPFTYRSAGTFTPRVTVMDTFGRAYTVFGSPVTVTALSPPAITLSATNGNIPYSTILTATTGPANTLDYDTAGRGRFDDLFSPPQSPFSPEIHRAGTFTARARVTDSSGVSQTATAPFLATATGTLGWMVAPRSGDRVSGTSVTLSAEATPKGAAKKVQFQYRPGSPPGAWTDIGGPVLSANTLVSTRWDVSALPTSQAVDLRVLINDSISSGDTANPVTVNAPNPTWSEGGGQLDVTLDPAHAKEIRTSPGVWVLAPAGGPSGVRIAPVGAPPGNGSAIGLAPAGGAWRITAAGSYDRPLGLRLPAPLDDPSLEIHAFDESAGVWYRPGVSRVSHDDGWVEADAFGPGIFALFRSTPDGTAAGGSGNGGRYCAASIGENPDAWILVLVLGFLAWRLRR
jgi:hypothetical protein